ncbi:hypothetical protein [Paractinoplanes durhamensis]|uniref:hypothetical protein n=1 Tax=Paractinoplanes durhamensis TaxID=113563 RepID=UPI00363F6E38
MAGQAATVLSAPGFSDESEMSYSGLQRLLGPVLDDLPVGRHEGFIRAIGGRPAGDCRLQIGLSVVALLRAAAARRGPILCLVDDAELLDFPSWQLLKLAVRRLAGAPVTLLATTVDTPAGREVASGLPVRHVGALDSPAAHSLIRHLTPDIADEVADGLVELAAGNPGALVELGSPLTVEQRRGSHRHRRTCHRRAPWGLGSGRSWRASRSRPGTCCCWPPRHHTPARPTWPHSPPRWATSSWAISGRRNGPEWSRWSARRCGFGRRCCGRSSIRTRLSAGGVPPTSRSPGSWRPAAGTSRPCCIGPRRRSRRTTRSPAS